MTEAEKPNTYGGARPLVENVGRVAGFGLFRAAVERAQTEAKRLADDRSGRAVDRSSRPLGPTRVHVTGLRGTAPVFLLEALRSRLDRPAVIVCPDQEAAEDFYSDLLTVSGARALLFPERDIFPHPYETRENLSVRGDRNEALQKIMGGAAEVVVTSLLGFLEKAIPAEFLRANQISISLNDTVDLDRLREELSNLGYDTVSVVEEAGQFAVRGSILDVFDPSWDYPARLELFDDEIISIRTFDLDTQRSIDNVDTLTVLPASSVPFDEETTGRLQQFLEGAGMEADRVEAVVAEVTHNRFSYLRRKYAPVMGMTGALLDYFDRTPLLCFTQVEGLNRAYARLGEEIERKKSRSLDDFPPLGLGDYLHDPDYFESYGTGPVYVWDLAAAAGVTGDQQVFKPVQPEEEAFRFNTTSHPSVAGNLNPLIGSARKLRRNNVSVYVFSETPTQRERLADMLDQDEDLFHLPVGWITSGFVWEEASIAVFTDHQIFNRILPRPRKKQKKRRVQGIRHDHLQVGDFVVHIDYGIGRFVGLEKVGSGEEQTECLKLRYLGGDNIYVPLDQMHLVEKYLAKEGVVPRIDRLGGSRWHKSKEKAKKSIEDVARDLLGVYAAREVASGFAFGPDTPWQKELEASFPYEETPHQLRATDEIKTDMELQKPMDRLVCGDVGYGKTEVAIRAAFKAVASGKQVAVLVPTTLLAYQHFHTFKERMANYPLTIRMLSRFISKSGQNTVLDDLKKGTIDVVIGTHRLLSKDVGFKDLGLLIVDEEHRFGVKHKEKLKRLIKSVDVLALTATPIPRTLYMSLSGLRKLSIIDTPPRNRHPVKTEVLSFDEEVIERAIAEEVSRDGQVFFVHNRVQSIQSVQAFLEKLLPGVRFCVAHGQMAEHQLEEVFLAFLDRKYDVLISTMIIESGLDFPNVNTIIVNRADRFGLAQLYQLRGRVGRRDVQAYAYFLIPRQMSLTEGAGKRLQAMEEFEELGSGYRLAMRDLEIRGAGNVLGVEQHGHVAAIGFDLYCKMLREAVDRLTGEEKTEKTVCKVEGPYRCYIPESYVEDADERMMLYKRLAGMSDVEEFEAIEAEFKDRFGEAPRPARCLLDLAGIKLQASLLGIAAVRFRLDRAPVERRDRTAALEKALRGVERIGRANNGVFDGLRPEGAGREAGEKADSGYVEFEFAPGKALRPEQCAGLVETFTPRLLFKSGDIFYVRLEAGPSAPLLADAKNLLQVAYFSSRMGNSPAVK